MPKPFLPLFPLQLVAFPGEQMNLHIFEQRYRQMINESHESGQTFGIPAFIDNKVMDIGTEMELIRIEKRYPDGKMDIKTKGLGLFRILDFQPKAQGKLYAGSEVERLSYTTDGDWMLNEQILELVKDLFQLLNIQKELPETAGDFISYDLGHQVGFSTEQEYEFLQLLNEKDRQGYMKDHLEKFIPTVREMENLRKRAQMNGHFKNIIPPKF